MQVPNSSETCRHQFLTVSFILFTEDARANTETSTTPYDTVEDGWDDRERDSPLILVNQELVWTWRGTRHWSVLKRDFQGNNTVICHSMHSRPVDVLDADF
jgi:hypothetical protein